MAGLLLGVSGGITWNGLTTLLAVIAPVDARDTAYGLAHSTRNLGLGAGAGVAGLLLAGGYGAFPVVFVGDAVLFVQFAVVLLVLGRRSTPRSAPQPSAAERPGGVTYRALLSDRRMRVVLVLGAAVGTAALSQVTTAVPALATGPTGLSSTTLGLALAGNAVVLAAIQLPVLRMTAGRRRSRLFAAGAVVFAASWALLIPSAPAAPLLVAALVTFAVGEALVAPSLPAITNDLAADATRGRYNAALNMSLQTGAVIGPAATGWLLDAGSPVVLLTVLVAANVLTACAAVAAGTVLPGAADRSRSRTTAPQVPAPDERSAL